MNILTPDIISKIVTRNFPIITRIRDRKKWLSIRYIDKTEHRIDGPAIIFNDDTWYWYFNGEVHRTDQTKPAVKTFKYYEWFNMGEFVAHQINLNYFTYVYDSE